jgi:starch synthase (maltosyl-transferring)
MSSLTTQSPAPGSHHIHFCGDRIRFVLTAPVGQSAFLRTTIGSASVLRQEIIDRVEKGIQSPARAWRDLPMIEVAPGQFTLDLPLLEVGRFEAKAYALFNDTPHWPDDEGNTVIKVEPAISATNNAIYKAFPRLFGDVDSQSTDEETVAIETLDAKGWSVIPPSGKFRDVAAQMPHIVDDMGFRILLLLPPFPTPTTFASMGRYGSPYASTDFRTVDPALAEFDESATPMDQFGELVRSTHEHGARLFIDLPVNHTGWASRLQTLHPEWFEKKDDGRFHSPGAWGVVWEDLVELNFDQRAVWEEIAQIFLFWCRRGVDGFRCDAGYMVPHRVWEYVIAKVRDEFPATCFFLEGLGGSKKIMERLLDTANLDWAYSELFQTYSREEFEHYLPDCERVSRDYGLLVHFAATHDNNRLAATSSNWSKIRMALMALLSHRGGWGITCGAEWLAKEKIDVHGRSALNWGAETNIIPWIAKLNDLIRTHPAFQEPSILTLLPQSNNVLAVRRSSVLILVNIDQHNKQTVGWSLEDFPGDEWEDLLGSGSYASTLIDLEPLQILCLSSDETVTEPSDQHLKETAERASLFLGREVDAADPIEGCRTENGYLPIIHWRPEPRIVTVPPGHLIFLNSPCAFQMENSAGKIVASSSCTPWSLIAPPQIPGTYTLSVEGQAPAKIEILPAVFPNFPTTLTGTKAITNDSYALLTNGRGAMSHARAAFGEIHSQYDCLLAANLNDDFPTDRTMLFARCRAWVTYRSQWCELNRTSLVRFSQKAGSVEWVFSIWLGSESNIQITVILELARGRNATRLRFFRKADAGPPIELILRPDVENRSFHEKTCRWDAHAEAHADGFTFANLRVHQPGATYHPGPEWATVQHPIDAERGLGPSSDLFSPGHLAITLAPGETTALFADTDGAAWTENIASEPATIEDHLTHAIRDFVVKRDEFQTVIAGYPWFLDWGRDTLICLRGMLAAGMIDETREILRQFGKFEKGGTLPNMIRGDDDSNRDTSDAPLWFVIVCRDLPEHDEEMNQKAIAIVRGYAAGTENGIKLDGASGLIFSPSHFTWMDTNHPAGTPREGYPIEIQALWIGALDFVAKIDDDSRWPALATLARKSLRDYFWQPELGYLSDCLHTAPGTPAAAAKADDHLRSNQLLAITLGILNDWPRADLAKILDASAELLVPGGIRSLADRPVTHPLPVYRDGHLLNHPDAPYWGQYTGDEDTRRKPAYHNGTVWTWPFPSYPEALFQVYGEDARAAALSYLAGSAPLFEQGCLGHLPEIIDGNAPHAQKGCGAQAWSVTEWLRVYAVLCGK